MTFLKRPKNFIRLVRKRIFLKSLLHGFAPVAKPIYLLLSLFVLGSLGYFIIGLIYERDWSFIDCAYMTSITLTTVGYSDVLNTFGFFTGKIYTMVLSLAGLGGTLYSISMLTAFLVEGRFKSRFREIAMMEEISELKNHSIICGAGESGVHVALEHHAKNRPFVIIEREVSTIENLQKKIPNLKFIIGDATKEEHLLSAQIASAKNLVACLESDKNNLFLLVTARFLSKKINIVAKCEDPSSTGKFIQAGANHVVNPGLIGGLKIASHVLSPHYSKLIDSFLKNGPAHHALMEIPIAKNSSFRDLSISEANLQEIHGVTILGLKRMQDNQMTYLPSSDSILVSGASILVLGHKKNVEKLLHEHEIEST